MSRPSSSEIRCSSATSRDAAKRRGDRAESDGAGRSRTMRRSTRRWPREDFGTAADLDAGHDDLYTDETRARQTAQASAGAADRLVARRQRRTDGDGEDFEGTPRRGRTLKEHLEAQLAIAGLAAAQRFIAEVLIDAVDEAGYLRADCEIAERLGCAAKILRARCSRCCRASSRPACCARDLAECLALQLKDRDRLRPGHGSAARPLDCSPSATLPRSAALCGVDDEDICARWSPRSAR